MDIEKRREAIRKYDSIPENKAKKKIYMAKYRLEYEKKNKDKIIERKKNYYITNKKEIDKKNKKWIDENKDKWDKYRKNYYLKNKKKIIAYGSDWERDMKKNDECFAIKKRLRDRLKQALKNYSKFGKTNTSDEYGINYDAIIEHLKPFPKDRHLYHIDHIKALCSFDLTNPEQVKIAFLPENHQWLLIEDNLKKISQDKMSSFKRKSKLLLNQMIINDNRHL